MRLSKYALLNFLLFANGNSNKSLVSAAGGSTPTIRKSTTRATSANSYASGIGNNDSSGSGSDSDTSPNKKIKASASGSSGSINSQYSKYENDLNTILNGCVSSNEMSNELHDVLKIVHSTNEIDSIMQRNLINVIEGYNGNINKESFRRIMIKYDKDIAVELRKKGYEANMGCGPMEDASGLAALNYATLKEILRAFKDVEDDQKRGVESKMDPAVSPCLIMVVQTIARAYVNSVREELGLDYEKCELVLKRVLLLDMVGVPFDNEDKTSKTYYTNVQKIATNLGLQSQSRLFAICYIKFLMQVIYHRIKQGDDPSPFPVMSLSSYTRKHWFGKHDKKTQLLIEMAPADDDMAPDDDDMLLMLVEDSGNIGHPEFFMRKGPRGQSQEWRDNQNGNINQFYSALQEVIDLLASSEEVMDAMNERFKDATVTKENLREYLLKLKVEAIERMDTKMTKEEREAMYQLMLEACKLGGDESARLLWLGQELEDLDYDYTLLSGVMLEEFNHFMGKKKYSGANGFELLKKNMISRVEGIKLGGAESGRLIVLGIALEDVCFMPEKLEGIALEEYRHFMAKEQYIGDEGINSLLKNAKSRLFGSRLGGKASADLLRLGQGMNEDYTFDSDEMENQYKDLLKSKYDDDEKRLLQVIKSRLNGWTVCQNVSRLRIAFMDKSTTISPEVYNQLDKEDKDLFDATTKMELADGTTIDKDKLYEMIAASALGWSFCIKLPRLVSILVRTAKERNIYVESQADVFSMEVYKAMSPEDDQEFTSIASEMKLKSTNGQPVDIQTLLGKMRSFHNGEYNEKVLDGHIGKCKQFMEEFCRDDKWYIPDCNGVNHSTQQYLWLIRDLESGDYGYWKVQAFADAGVDLSKWDQSLNVDITDKEKDKKTAPMREKRKAVKSREKKKVVTKKT